jgi:hypothetical protein
MAGYIDGKVDIWYGVNPPANQNILWMQRGSTHSFEPSSLYEFNNETQSWVMFSKSDPVVIDNLDSFDSLAGLSANQGRLIKVSLDSLELNKEPVIPEKGTAFNLNFGTAAGTILEGRTFGSAANNDIEDFATTSQGALADSSLQPDSIVQESGQSTSSIMSQKAVTDAIETATAVVPSGVTITTETELNQTVIVDTYPVALSTPGTISSLLGSQTFSLEVLELQTSDIPSPEAPLVVTQVAFVTSGSTKGTYSRTVSYNGATYTPTTFTLTNSNTTNLIHTTGNEIKYGDLSTNNFGWYINSQAALDAILTSTANSAKIAVHYLAIQTTVDQSSTELGLIFGYDYYAPNYTIKGATIITTTEFIKYGSEPFAYSRRVQRAFSYKYNSWVSRSKNANNTWNPWIVDSNLTDTNVGSLILASASATPNDTDYFTLITNSGVLEKLTGTSLKSYLKTYFDSIYPTIANRNILITSIIAPAPTISANNILQLNFLEDLLKNKTTTLLASFGVGAFVNPPAAGANIVKTFLLINGSASDQPITFNTSDQVVGDVTYKLVYMKDTSLVANIPAGKTLEISYLFTYISATVCNVEIIYIIQP